MKKRLLIGILFLLVGLSFVVVGQIGEGGEPECSIGDTRDCTPVDCTNGYGQQSCTELLWGSCECVTIDCYEKGVPRNIVGSPSEQEDLIWNGSEFQYMDYNNFVTIKPDGSEINEITVYGTRTTPYFAWTGTEYGSITTAMTDPELRFAGLHFTSLYPNLSKKLPETLVSGNFGDIVLGDLVWNRNDYAAVWAAKNRGLYFTRFNSSGVSILSDVQITDSDKVYEYATKGDNPTLVWNPDNLEYGIAWKDKATYNSGSTGNDIRFARLNTDGSIKSILLEVEDYDSYVESCYFVGEDCRVSLIWTGREYAVVWNNKVDKNVYFARINRYGEKIGSNTRINSTYYVLQTDSTRNAYLESPSVAWNGKEYFVAWNNKNSYNNRVYTGLTRIYPNGSKMIGQSHIIIGPSTYRSWTSLAWNGSGFGIIWLYREPLINAYHYIYSSYNKIPCPLCEPEDATEDCTTDAYTISTAPTSCIGTRTCSNKNWGDCVIDIVSEGSVCDGLDNDCDGLIDNILNTKQDGVCAGSFKKCVGEAAVDDYSSVLDYEATETLCTDTLDNDCDGLVDEQDDDCVTLGDCSACSGMSCIPTECHDEDKYGDCYWVDTGIPGFGGDCYDIADATLCPDFNDDEFVCNNNALHQLGCMYNDVDKVCEESDILCGNGVPDETDPITGVVENCLTCQEDNGCTSGYYCQADGSCGDSLDTTNCDDPPDGICDSGETCGCSGCDGEQAGCASEYVCGTDGGGCTEDDIGSYMDYTCDDLDGLDCPPTHYITGEQQFCVSIWNYGLPYVQTTPVYGTDTCCLTGICGTTDDEIVPGMVTLLTKGDCEPKGEGAKGSMLITTTVYDGGNVVETLSSSKYEDCLIPKKLMLPFYGLSGIIVTLLILSGFYFLRFSKKD